MTSICTLHFDLARIVNDVISPIHNKQVIIIWRLNLGATSRNLQRRNSLQQFIRKPSVPTPHDEEFRMRACSITSDNHGVIP